MTTDKFNDSISRLLDEGRLGHVITVLKDKCRAGLQAHPDLQRLLSSLERLEDSYFHMRMFVINGGDDPQRADFLENLKEQLRDLGRQYLFITNEDRLDPLFAEYRLQKVRRESVSDLARRLATGVIDGSFGDTLEALFRKVWSLPPWDVEDHRAVEALFEESDYVVSSQLISALLLGLLRFNDPAKFLLLLKAYDGASDERVAARALTAIVLVLGRWGSRALSTAQTRGAVEALEDSLLTYSRVRDIVMTLIKTRDTDRVSREVSDAFNATMKEITPEMLEKLQREGMTIDSSETGFNPEWEKLMHNKEIEDKMMAINEMQLEGLDVMMQTFSRLKTFPFFRSISNWFVPFTEDNPAVEELFSTFSPEGFRVMADATEMCASDRFSFALGIMQMPPERRNMLAMHFGSQLEALKDLVKDRENVRRKPVFATEALLFARDLYRFAKLFPRRRDFHDPFGEPIDFLQLPMLGSLLEGDDIILTSADFYFRHGYYPQALALYQGAVGSADGMRPDQLRGLYEKIGFCHQMAGDYASALTNYEKADLFSSDTDRSSSWLLRKLAFTNKAVGRYDRAAEYYSRLLEGNPDDLKLIFHLGSVLLRSGDTAAFGRGKELISKVHYLDPDHKMAGRVYKRLQAHDAFLEGAYGEALRLYEEGRGDQPWPDYRRDLEAELLQVAPGADVTTLQILLDSGD